MHSWLVLSVPSSAFSLSRFFHVPPFAQQRTKIEHLNDDNLELQLFGTRTQRVEIPDGAIDLFPSKIGARILHLPDTNQILKAGSKVKLSEAEAMRLIARQTSIPVPRVQDAYVKDEIGYIFMSREKGKRLADV